MPKIINTKAQGAFEYILLLGGILLIVVVSIIILRGSVLNQTNKQIVGNTNAWQNTVCIPTYLGDSTAVGVWHFDGDATDSSGKGNHGTLNVGGDASFVSGKKGQALNPGINGYVMVPDSSSLDLTNGATLEAWIKPTANYDEPIMEKDGGGMAYALHIGYSVYNVHAFFSTTGLGWNIDGPYSAIPIGEWVHVAITRDGTTGRVANYVNGKFIGELTLAVGNLYNTGTSLGIGTNGAHSIHFEGQIDEAIIYNRVLSEQEIQKDMNCAG